MAILLLIDANGQRRARLEAACEIAGHRAYCAGTAEEALRLAELYVPEAILVSGDLPDASALAMVESVRGRERALLRRVLVVSSLPLPADGAYTYRAPSDKPQALLAAVADALSARRADCEELTEEGNGGTA